ncbi:unnamed protein product [Taenia asiatica]|uniref:Uncharacterized protein n=1 Tax=Taenia asiatica TaxID=60517 RepID=A0A0R3VXP3_TAEAS|nr:unnamed protein product [Taenia asiatica]
MGDSRMSIIEKSTERFYRFSAYDSNEAKRRMRSLHRKAQSNEEVMEPEALCENKTWRDSSNSTKSHEEEKYREGKGKRRGKSAGRELPAVGFAPDPTAERDLDNASPETIDFCGKFKCHYCIFIYLASNEVDDELYPFFRAECAEMVKNAEICDTARCRLVQSEEVQGSLKDRRLKALEAQTQCSVRLGKLHGRRSIIKGLPRRRLTIGGPSFNHICHAVQMMEHMFPRLMQYAIFPYRFPAENDLLKFQSNRTFDHHSHEAALRLPGASSLISKVDDRSNWRKFICPK